MCAVQHPSLRDLGCRRIRSPRALHHRGSRRRAIAALACDLEAHGCPPGQMSSVSIVMSPAFMKGVSEELPNAQIAFDKFHVIWHANAAVDRTRRIEQRTDQTHKRHALDAAQGQLPAQARSRRLPLCIDHSAEPQTHGPSVALQGAIARDPRAPAGQRDAPHAAVLGHLRHALEGPTEQGSCRARAPPHGRHRGLDADASDQRLPRGHQRPVPGCQNVAHAASCACPLSRRSSS